jgi:hypothetical protein
MTDHTDRKTLEKKFTSKNDFWGLCSVLVCVKVDPKILEKKKFRTIADNIPDGSPKK